MDFPVGLPIGFPKATTQSGRWQPWAAAQRVVIGLAPEHLSALAVSGRLRPRLIDRHARPLPDQSPGRWDKGIAALEALLAEPGWRDSDITVLLSSHYVRHAIVPPAPGLAEAERQALAQVVFKDIFGELANDWEIRSSPTRVGASTLASGVPRSLLAELRRVTTTHGRLVSIQPGLMPVFNRARRDIGDAAACLALVEPGRVTLASVDDGQWKYIDSRAGNGNVLPQLLLEEGELHERQPGGLLWLCDLTDATRLPPDSYWSVHRITPRTLAGVEDADSPASASAFSLAIWGVT